MNCKSFFITGIITFCLLALCFSCKEEPTSKSVKAVEIRFKKEGTLTIRKAQTDSIIATLDIEIADDDYQRETGLMYRQDMKDDQGMLFVFAKPEYRNFYMKNTQIPLDIIYLDSEKKVLNIRKNSKPMDESSLTSTAPAQFVLEINAGLSDKWGIDPGDYIEY